MLLKVVFAGSAYPPTHWSFLQVPSEANFCDTKISRRHVFRGGQDNRFATFKTKIGPLQSSQIAKTKSINLRAGRYGRGVMHCKNKESYLG